MKNFVERETYCEMTFSNFGPYWHLYTPGKDTPLTFATPSDLAFVMNVIALVASGMKVRIIAFEVMGNHLHFVLAGQREEAFEFWEQVRRRIARHYPVFKNMPCGLKEIENIQALRNNIVYVNRNGYVADPSHTPFSYPWGTGRYYFLDAPEGRALSETIIDERRKMFRTREPDIPFEWRVCNGYILPSEYCALNFGMSVFRDAHHYFSLVSKNIESYRELAVELDDGEFLTDQELFAQIFKYLRSSYGADRLSAISKAQKLDLAVKLRQEFRSSNGQIRRVLGLSAYEVDSLFPLTKK